MVLIRGTGAVYIYFPAASLRSLLQPRLLTTRQSIARCSGEAGDYIVFFLLSLCLSSHSLAHSLLTLTRTHTRALPSLFAHFSHIHTHTHPRQRHACSFFVARDYFVDLNNNNTLRFFFVFLCFASSWESSGETSSSPTQPPEVCFFSLHWWRQRTWMTLPPHCKYWADLTVPSH